jgi:hypothetical protein
MTLFRKYSAYSGRLSTISNLALRSNPPTKSVHTTLVHLRSGLCLLLCSDFLDRRGNCGLIVEV